MELGYAISSEEHRTLDLVQNAVRAEETGFGFALVSDHFHPWIDRQGQSPFVWSVLGGIAAEWWPNAALKGPLGQELPLPSHFEEAAAMVSEEDVAKVVVCGPDVDSPLELIEKYLDVYASEILPRYPRAAVGV